MDKIHQPRKEPKAIFFLLLFMAAAVIVYYIFFDILIPNIQNDSYRAAVGPFFIIPVIILAVGQAFLGGIIFYLFSKAYRPEKADFLRASLIGAALTFWFSLTYALFPKYGPFYYIVFIYGEAPWYALPVEIAWTVTAILIGTFLTRKIFAMPLKKCFYASVVVYTVMTLGAS